MQSLKQKIRLQEYEIGNDRALILAEWALLKQTMGQPKYVGLSFLSGFGLGMLLDHPQTEKLKNKISRAPSIFRQAVSHLQFILPLLMG